MDRNTIELFEKKTGEHFKTGKDLESYLSERFNEIHKTSDDAQFTYDELNNELDGLLGSYFSYSLSENDETWTVDKGDFYEESQLPQYLSAFNEAYAANHTTIDDLLGGLENRALKDMSNAGIDAKNALNLILEDDLHIPGAFSIVGADATPRILFNE